MSDGRLGTRDWVVSEAELVEAVARDRAAGRRFAFANGCFDLLHVGHVRYLAGAAAEGRPADRRGERRSDRSPALKGPGRPIVPAAERAEIVAALAPRRLRHRLRRSRPSSGCCAC